MRSNAATTGAPFLTPLVEPLSRLRVLEPGPGETLFDVGDEDVLGADLELELELSECDPAGVVFEEHPLELGVLVFECGDLVAELLEVVGVLACAAAEYAGESLLHALREELGRGGERHRRACRG